MKEKGYSNAVLLEHPLIQHKITLLRDKNTKPKEFRELVKELTALMAYDLTADLQLDDQLIETPLGEFLGKTLRNNIVILPILRAGLGMAESLLILLPNAKTGHIGVYRDEKTTNPVFYYQKLPSLLGAHVLLLDPMLATGGSASYCIDLLKGNKCRNIKLACLIAAEAGVMRLKKEHPDVMIYTCAIDKILDSRAYIVPGLGDSGDRQFNT